MEINKFQEKLKFILNDEENIIHDNQIIISNDLYKDKTINKEKDNLLDKNYTDNYCHECNYFNKSINNDGENCINEEPLENNVMGIKSMKILPLTNYFFNK